MTDSPRASCLTLDHRLQSYDLSCTKSPAADKPPLSRTVWLAGVKNAIEATGFLDGNFSWELSAAISLNVSLPKLQHSVNYL